MRLTWEWGNLAAPRRLQEDTCRNRGFLRQGHERALGYFPASSCCCCCLVLNHVRLFATPWTVTHQALCPRDSPGKNTGVAGCHFLLQGIFPTQGSNLCLLPWQEDSLPLSHQGSPVRLGDVLSFQVFLLQQLQLQRGRAQHLLLAPGHQLWSLGVCLCSPEGSGRERRECQAFRAPACELCTGGADTQPKQRPGR